MTKISKILNIAGVASVAALSVPALLIGTPLGSSYAYLTDIGETQVNKCTIALDPSAKVVEYFPTFTKNDIKGTVYHFRKGIQIFNNGYVDAYVRARIDFAPTEEKSTALAAGDNESAPFSATMLNVGQGLSVLIQSDGHNMLYDGGSRAHSSYVVSYLQQHGVDFLDYMVASHYDEDHIAGLVGVLNTTPVSTILCPDYQADSKIYESFVKGEETSGAQIEHSDAGEEYLLGDAKIEVLQDDPSLEEANNKSIAVKVSYGTFSMLLTDDAEQEAEEEMIRSGQDLHADLYVTGHHGSSSSSSQDFSREELMKEGYSPCGMCQP